MVMWASLMYSGNEVKRADFASSCLYNFVSRFRVGTPGFNPTGRTSIAHVAFAIIAILNNGCSNSKLYLSSTAGTKCFCSSFPTH
jgi:hypothetical protein